MSPSDDQLLAGAASGDPEALKALLERYGPPVRATIDAEIGQTWRSAIDADDVMQVTYMEAFLYADRLTARDGDAFRAWLQQVARNNLRDAIKELDRKKRPSPARRVHATGEDSYVALVEMLGATTSTPSRQVAQQEAAEAINAVLERLPPDYAKVIRLCDLQGRAVAEVAAEMGRSPGTIHMLRARAHDQLRELLGAETNFFTHAP